MSCEHARCRGQRRRSRGTWPAASSSELSITLLIDWRRSQLSPAPSLFPTHAARWSPSPTFSAGAAVGPAAPRWRLRRAEAAGGHEPTKQDQAEAVRALSKLKNVRREDLVTLRPQSEVAVGLNRAEWKRKVDSTRSSAVSAVRVRHILVQSEEMQRGLHDMLKGGADFTELARASSDCASTREKGGEIGWSGVNDEHLDEILPKAVRELAIATKPGDVVLAESALGRHLVQVVDVFQTLQVDSNPRTRGLPGSGLKPRPLIELLRASRDDDRSFKQLQQAASSAACWAPRARAAAAATRRARRSRPATALRAAAEGAGADGVLDGVDGVPDELCRCGADGGAAAGAGVCEGGGAARRAGGGAQHVLDPRARAGEGVLVPRAARPAEAARRGHGDHRRGVRRAAGGRGADAQGARDRHGDGAAVRQPARRPARGRLQRQPDRRHRTHPHHGGPYAAAACIHHLRVGQRHLRMQRAMLVLRGADDARLGAVAAARGDPEGDRRAHRRRLHEGLAAPLPASTPPPTHPPPHR